MDALRKFKTLRRIKMSAVCEYQAQIKPSREKWALNRSQM